MGYMDVPEISSAGNAAPPEQPKQDPNIRVMSDMTDYFTRSGMSPTYSPQELDAMRKDIGDAQERSYGPGIAALVALAALSALGGKAGRRSAGMTAQNFSQGYMTGQEQGVKARLDSVASKWKAVADEKKANADIMKAVMPELMKERFKNFSGSGLPDKARLWNFRQGLPADQQVSFDDFLAKPEPEKMASPGQYLVSLLQKQTAGGLTPQEEKVIPNLMQALNPERPVDLMALEMLSPEMRARYNLGRGGAGPKPGETPKFR